MAQIINKADGTGEIRCGGLDDPRRPHNGLIARWNSKGLLLWCGDCRHPNGRRGKQHLIEWPVIFGLFVALGGGHGNKHSNGTSGPGGET